MEDNRIDEEVHEAEGSVEEEAAGRGGVRNQIVKYVAIWVAVVALFFGFNAVIKSAMAKRVTAGQSEYGASYYGAGQPAGYAQQNGAGAGAGACGGECCGTGQAAPGAGGTNANAAPGNIDTTDLEQVEKAAIEWYAAQTGDSNVIAEARDLGCHHEITIKKGDKVVGELSLRNGQFSSLTPW